MLDMNKKIVFVGGDKRQLYAARKLRGEGFPVYMYGFERLEDCDIHELDSFYLADIIVLPITGVKGDTVPAQYSEKELKVNFSKLSGKCVITGKARTLGKTDCRVYDILECEKFAAANALPTAESAVMLAMENFEGTVSGAKCLVIGYGRIGKVLSRMLRALNADVTVATHTLEKAGNIRADGNRYAATCNIESISVYDIVFNTADALIIDEKILKNSGKGALIIDLASLPGGVDFKTAESLGFRTIHALGLPGRYSPKAAGEIISDAILTILEEE